MLVSAVKCHQNDQDYFMLPMRHDDVVSIHEVIAFSKNQKKGDQRPFSKKHASQFARKIETKGATRPNSIVGSMQNGRIIREYTINGVTICEIEFEKLRTVDGQHGIKAVEMLKDNNASIYNNWEWPIVAGLNLTDEQCQMLHSGINSYQKKPNKSVNLYMEYLNNRLTSRQQFVGRILERLNSDPESVLCNRILLHHDDKQSGTVGFADMLNRIANEDGNQTKFFGGRAFDLRHFSDEEAYGLAKVYFNAWANGHETEWNDKIGYSFGDKMGIKVLCRCLEPVFKVAEKEFGAITEENVINVIKMASRNMHMQIWACKTGGKYHYKVESDLTNEMRRTIRFRPRTRRDLPSPISRETMENVRG